VLFMLVAAVLIGLVAVSTALGLVWRASQGRVRAASGRIDGLELGSRATLLQISSEFCAPCRATNRVLGEVSTDGIRHIEVDIADRPELVSRFNVMQIPTTFILDAHGVVQARIGGAVRRDLVVAELDRVLAGVRLAVA
jgi:thiol-disulfide isomerase/thioredoxin